MKLNELQAPAGANRNRRRKGRGESSGLGKTSGRGTKGQGSRKSGNVRPGFEGGQMPLIRRLPKRGFTNIFRLEYAVLNLRDLQRAFEAGETVTLESAKDKGLIRKDSTALKVLANGDLTKKLSVSAARLSAQAKAKIEAAGGTAEELTARKKILPMKFLKKLDAAQAKFDAAHPKE
jgi:large subunit ribosomal protein L15